MGPDLWALIHDIGARLIDATPVMTIRSADASRACLRLTFADGTVLKGRRVETAADAERIETLGSLLDPRIFPRVLARRGRALLTEWINGTSLQSDDVTPDLVRRCGRVQADLHGLDLSPAAATLRRRRWEWEPWLTASLRDLVGSRAIETSMAKDISRLAAGHAPRETHVRLCHGDFCAENIVRTAAGTICVVDNDTLAVDAGEYDLARTWYRWPMEASEQRAYAEGYGRGELGRRFGAHFMHWALMAVIESCRFRVRVGAASARVPLRRLQALVESEGRTERLPKLLGSG